MRTKNTKLNIITSLILNFITILYGFIVPKIIISHFGSNVNGLISSITQFLAYITLLESGFGPVIKAKLYKPIAEKDNNTIVSIIKITEKFFHKIAFAFIVYILALGVIYPIFINTSFNFVYTLSLIIIISISTFAEYFFGMTYRLFLQAEQKTYVISVIQIIGYILCITVIMILTYFGCSIHILKLVTSIIFVIRPICQNMYVKKNFNIDFNKYDKNYKLENKWDGLAQHIASVIHGNTDITILTIFSTLLEVSVYSIYSLVVNGIKSIIQSFTSGIDAIFGNMLSNKEKENLNNKFKLYEISYLSVCTIIFCTAIIMIVPFIEIFTKGVNDVNYVRFTFGCLLVLSEFIWAIRLPYISLTYSAGHFKETQLGAWIECISNIVISILLVKKLGIIGVTMGTIVAMTIRTIEFIYHSNKYILERNIIESVKKIIIVLIETIIILIIGNLIPQLNNINYFNWIINSLVIFIISSFVVGGIDLMFYKKEIKVILNMLIKKVNCKSE